MNQQSIYIHLPIFAQKIAFKLYSAKLYQNRYSGAYNDYYESLLKSENSSLDDIRRYKEENIFRILDYAYRHCPYYKESFRKANVTPNDFKKIDDLKKFPTLQKEDVRNNINGMISDEYSVKDLIHYHTSGSTGKGLDFFWTKDSQHFSWAVVWRGRKRFGIDKGDLQLDFTGKLVTPISQTKPPFWRFNPYLNQYMINMQHFTHEKINSIVSFINDHDFKFYCGYPSIIFSFANLVEENGLKINNPPLCIFTGAEKLYDYQSDQIKKILPDTNIVERYGFSEDAAAATQCRHFKYHEDWEFGHFELKNAVEISNGSTGELLATGFHNYGMPFIRYEVGDTATFSDELCDCGLKSQVISAIEGRNEDYVITPEGTHIMRFDYIFKDTHAIKECQVVQKELGSIILRIVRRPGYNMSVEKDLEKAVHEMISPSLNVKFEYVESIPRTKAGKFKAVVSEL